MAKSWLLGQPAEILGVEPRYTGTIVRTFYVDTKLMVVIQDADGYLRTVESSTMRVLAEPKTN